MSYILDALKKSQQDRETIAADNPPVFAPAVTFEKRSKVAAKFLVMFVIVLLLAFILFLTTSKPIKKSEQVIQVESAKVVFVEPLMLESVVNTPEIMTIDEPEQQVNADIMNEKPADDAVGQNAQQPATVQERRLPPLGSLRKIPALIINSHIYSGLPSKRSVTINNRSQREGDYLSSDVFIKEITAQGLIIEVDGWPLNISRQQGWQPIPEGS